MEIHSARETAGLQQTKLPQRESPRAPAAEDLTDGLWVQLHSARLTIAELEDKVERTELALSAAHANAPVAAATLQVRASV